MKVPDANGGAGNKLTLTARLLYRKFAWWNTQFAFAGVPVANQPESALTPHYDDRKYEFTGDLKGVSAKQEKIPDVPIVTVAQNQATLEVLPGGAPYLNRKLNCARKTGSAGTTTASVCSARRLESCAGSL
jgi:hypothetical protein